MSLPLTKLRIVRPGKRGRYWVKLKKELDTIDAIIVVAEYGHGKRADVLSDYTFAVRQNDDTNSELRIIGKAYSGLTDIEILQITKD
jgi:DNA ligase-1